MADSAITSNVFIDTQVFDRHSRDFTSANFRRLTRLASAGSIRLFLTTITEREIRNHLDNDSRAAFKQLKNYKRASRLVKRILPAPQFEPSDEEELRKDLHEEFDRFKTDAQVTIVPVDGISPESVFKRYFEQEAPFGEQGKKNEFPDAFAIAALQKWCEENKSKMYVVTEDGDWKRACKGNTNLVHLGTIEELLEKFQDSVIVTAIKEFLQERSEEVENLARGDTENFDFFVSDNLVDGECEDVTVEVDCQDFHVVEAKDGQAVVTAFCLLHISASVTADDPDSMWTDPDTREVRSVWHLRGTVDVEVERDVSINVAYDVNRPEEVSIVKAAFDEKSVEIDVDEGDLTSTVEEEYEEPDFFLPEDD